MRTRVVVLVTMLATSMVVMGCSERVGRVDAPTSPTSPPAAASCNALKAEFTIGQSASDDLLERARVAAGAGSARFIRPNRIITLEFLGSRLNVNLDAKDVVRSVTCG
jgi:hypothetical protein